ncbi:DUF4270 family protein [Dyadobacter sediminis]|uniref:DUF4270 domain-containing protein n=1 Tax=Dyadobacter sediminis TaxID=1493691 RepID=A0A5R9KF79_9BACT|nr:DUF4270 family protein [Dyadobacter sediminis]TLU94773.1 DUF4270 domain-containing protein [Dyadobacter sediminis]GGB88297.1 hypothetical protein GCM10011325_14760 [Dyadobacter sediminis]
MKFNPFFYKRSTAVFKLLVLFSLFAYITGCTSDVQIEALVQPNPDDFAVLFSDTSTVALSSVITDSMMTGASERMLIGRYVDPYFGKIQAASYFQTTTSGAVTVPELAVYDSLVLSLKYDGYTYGDTTVAMNLSVHKLQSDILNKNAYYNANTMPFDAVPVGQAKVVPRPRTNNQLRIKLSDVLGKDLFAKAQNNQITSNNDWINLVKGLVLKPAVTDNGSLAGFTRGNTNVQIHYHVSNADGIKKDSSTVSLTANYNQILADRAGTQLVKLPATHRISLPSSQTGNMSFIQAGLGTMTRVDFPFINQLKYNKFTVVNRAVLRVTPLRASVSNFTAPPAMLYVYLCDKNNELLIGSSDGLPIPLSELNGRVAVSGSYFTDLINNKQFYLLDVSSFVSSLVSSDFAQTGGLLIRTSPYGKSAQYYDAGTEFSQSVNRLVIGDQNNGDPGVKLELYYTYVKAE